MALENLKSGLGPTNKIGKSGTGQKPPAISGGLTGPQSKYATPEKNGKLPKGPDTGGNIPAEKLTTLQPK